MKKFLLTILTLFCFCAIYAQPTFDENTTDMVPVDGGITALLAAGIGYGVKKAYDQKKGKS